MGLILELVKECDVRWVELGVVIKLEKGKQLNKELLSDDGLYPAYNGGVSYSGFTNICNFNENTIIISQGGASAGFVNFITTKFYANAHCYVVLPDEKIAKNRYVYHFLKQNQEKLTNKQHGAGIPALKTNEILNLKIPIPPLDIQSKIVQILDNFTELTAELCLRKKQYEYYRDKLLSFDSNVKWVELGEIAEISRGASPRPISRFITDDENGIPWIKIGDTSPDSKYIYKTKQKITLEGAKKSRILKKGDFVLSNSMSFGRPYILGIKGAIHDGWASISNFNHFLNSDFLYFYLSTNSVKKYWLSKINSGSVSNLNSEIIKSLLVPVIQLEEQERIVQILDKFNTLANSLNEGLPKEIELRVKQYEYYRDKLLDFKKL